MSGARDNLWSGSLTRKRMGATYQAFQQFCPAAHGTWHLRVRIMIKEISVAEWFPPTPLTGHLLQACHALDSNVSGISNPSTQ